MITNPHGFEVDVPADSFANNVRLTTLSLRYPRFIHAEFMTHRMFSRNASSSRAIPVEKLLKQIGEQPATPIHWGKNQPGMQAREEHDDLVQVKTSGGFHCVPKLWAWGDAAHDAAKYADAFSRAGYHKQIVNRLTEPFQFIKVVVTATEWDNFFTLRLHPDAQPEIQELARMMKQAMDKSKPTPLQPGEWHTPFVDIGQSAGSRGFLARAIKCSVARCARVSYQNHDGSNPSLDKDIALHDQLLAAGHMSPFEHVATPMDITDRPGITHTDRNGESWSANFRGWIQYRQTL